MHRKRAVKLEFLTTKKKIIRGQLYHKMKQDFFEKNMGRLSTKLNGGKIRLFSMCLLIVITNSSRVLRNLYECNY